MNRLDHPPSTALAPLAWAWLALIVLTLLSLSFGQWLHGATWLPLLVAAIVWIKGTLVARYFIEAPLAHRFIAGVLKAFIAIAPIALILTALLSGQFAG